jgi:DNA replication and repair protein RecF
MRERNRLLSQQREGAWVASIEHKMAEASVAVAAARLEALQQLQTAMTLLHPAFPQAEIALLGFAENALEEGTSALVVEESLAAQLAQSRHSDAALGRSSHGAHKMEILVTHREKQMPAELCSTGEQKALLLSLLLAQTQALATRQHRLPILLLDEVVAHLDPDRRQALFTVLEALGVQAFLTGTEPALFEGISAEICLTQL